MSFLVCVERAWIVQRGEFRNLLEFGPNSFVDEHRFPEPAATMDEAMADDCYRFVREPAQLRAAPQKLLRFGIKQTEFKAAGAGVDDQNTQARAQSA